MTRFVADLPALPDQELSLSGTAARGAMGPQSDVDMLVEFMPDAPVTLFQRAAVEREVSEWLAQG